jgi:hypothetical protein
MNSPSSILVFEQLHNFPPFLAKRISGHVYYLLKLFQMLSLTFTKLRPKAAPN